MKISVNIPSWHRADDVLTLKYLPFANVWVDESEVDEYRKKNPKAEIVSCGKGIQGNTSRVRNHILDEEFKKGMEVVCMVDDDLYRLERFVKEEGTNFGYIREKVETDEFMDFLDKYTLNAQEIGAKMWGVNLNSDPMSYRHCSPFSTVSIVLGPFSVFLKGNKCRYDESLPLKEDYDMSIQQLNEERVLFRVNSYHYICRQSTNKGGCATMRNREKEREQIELLREKWGSDIVKFDTTNKGRSKKKKLDDYNPIIHIPIKGI